MALQSRYAKADRRRKIRFSVYPIRWKKKRGLCPWAVYNLVTPNGRRDEVVFQPVRLVFHLWVVIP
jgi:hypothetical protein